MDKMDKPATNQGEASTYIEHDCYERHTEHWHNQRNATYLTCGICGRMLGFRYKSFWKRLRNFFTTKVKKIS